MKILVFDLDGTLVDSFEDIAAAANRILVLDRGRLLYDGAANGLIDLARGRGIQHSYRLEALSRWTNRRAPPAAPPRLRHPVPRWDPLAGRITVLARQGLIRRAGAKLRIGAF